MCLHVRQASEYAAETPAFNVAYFLNMNVNTFYEGINADCKSYESFLLRKA